jgi:hypothetical protein
MPVKLNGSTSGSVTIQAPAIAGTNTLTLPAATGNLLSDQSIVPGSASVPTNGMYLPATNALGFATNSTNALYIGSSQNVGIGTTSPQGKLDTAGTITSSSSGKLLNLGWSGTDAYIQTTDGSFSAYNLIFYGGAAERMRIDSSGNVGIGTTSPGAKLGVSDGTVTLITSPYSAGSTGYFGTSTNHSLSLLTNNAERMRINSSGNLLINTTSVLNSAMVTIVHTGSSQIVSRNSAATAGKFWSSPYVDSTNSIYIIDNNNVGVVMASGATAWSANSDERLKDIIAPITSALEGVQSLRAVKYSWKSDADKVAHIGLIAQDVQKVLPEVVASAKLPMSEDETEYLSVAYTEVIPLLVAAIQELSAEVEALKAKIGV